jgi:hypothetical protein
MSAAGPGRAGAYSKTAGEFGLAGRSQRRTFLVTDADPFDFAAPNGIGDWIE